MKIIKRPTQVGLFFTEEIATKEGGAPSPHDLFTKTFVTCFAEFCVILRADHSQNDYGDSSSKVLEDVREPFPKKSPCVRIPNQKNSQDARLGCL